MSHSMTGPTTLDASLSVHDLLATISEAASQDATVMLAAGTRLKEYVKLPGTVNGLHQIASQKSLPLSTRQLAIIQCKNEIPTQWRQRKLFTLQDKDQIRERCTLFLDEEDEVISRCNEIIVSKISRSDYPNSWPTLIDDLILRVQNGFSERSHFPDVEHEPSFRVLKRILRVLKAIVKEFAAIRMPLGVQVMGKIMSIIHGPLSMQYERSSTDLRSKLDISAGSTSRVTEDIHLCRLLLKCVTLMATWVWQSSATARRDVSKGFEDWVIRVFQASIIDLRSIYEARRTLLISLNAGGVRGTLRVAAEGLTQYVRTIGKFFRRLQQLKSAQFASLPSVEQLVSFYWDQVIQSSRGPDLIGDASTAIFPVHFLVQAMAIFRDALAQWSPKRASSETTAIDHNFVQTAITFLVTQFMPLKRSDLESWMADPEDFVNVEDKEDVQWEFSVRPCAERVLMTLSSQFPEITNPLLISAFNNVNSEPPATFDKILEKEAVYGAIGRCSHRLKDAIDLSGWLDIAIREAQSPERDYLIIKRRIAWLLGRWMIEGTISPQEARVWEILVHLLSDSGIPGSEVVRLTAATAIELSVDSIHVTIDMFAPYLPVMLSQLVNLMEQVESLESKRKVNDNLNAVIARAGDKIGPYAEIITAHVPQLWTKSGKDFLLKTSIMNTMAALYTSLQERSAPLASLAVPIIAESLSPEFAVELDEAGLHLWQTALRHATTLQSFNGGPGFADLFSLLVRLLQNNLDLLGKITEILESYFLLGASDLMQAYALPLFSAYIAALEGALSANVRDLLSSLELLFQLANPAAYVQALHASGMFAWLSKSLAEDKLDILTLTAIVYIHARIVIGSCESYLSLMAATAQSSGTPEPEIWNGVLDQWWRRFDNIADPRYRKLCALGAAALLSTGRTEVLDRLPFEIFTLWSDVFAELKEVERQREDGEAALSLYWDQPTNSFFKGTQDTPEYARRKAVFDNDIVRRTLMSAYIAHHLQEAENICGSRALKSILGKADENLWKSIEKEVFGHA